MQITIHMTEEEYEQYAAYKKDSANYKSLVYKEAHKIEAGFREKIDEMCSLTLGAFDADVPLETESIPQLVDIDSAKKLIEEAAEWYS